MYLVIFLWIDTDQKFFFWYQSKHSANQLFINQIFLIDINFHSDNIIFYPESHNII